MRAELLSCHGQACGLLSFGSGSRKSNLVSEFELTAPKMCFLFLPPSVALLRFCFCSELVA